MNHNLKRSGRATVHHHCRYLIVWLIALSAGNVLPVFSQDVTMPKIAPTSIFILQDFVDNFEQGLAAGGNYTTFGEDSGAFELVDDPVHSGQFALKLATKPGGFSAGNTIGFAKVFTQPINLTSNNNTPDYTHVSYWVRSTTSIDTIRFVEMKIVIGEGGEEVKDSQGNVISMSSGSTWKQTAITRLNLAQISDHYTQVLIPLIPRTDNQPGFFQESPTQNRPFDFSDITRIQINMVRFDSGGNDVTKTIFIDDIRFLDLNRQFNLQVQAKNLNGDKIDGVSISGSHPGITSYSLSVANNLTVTLIASPKTTGDYKFLYWEKDGQIQPQGMNSLSFTFSEVTTATAVYGIGNLVSVTSHPMGSIPISSNTGHNGQTNYQFLVAANQVVDLTAPSSMEIGNTTRNFLHWLILGDNDIDQEIVNQNFNQVIRSDVTVIAIYEPVIQIKPGWNLISTPVHLLSHASFAELFPESDTIVWSWNGKSYRLIPRTSQMLPFHGYWLFSAVAKTIPIHGTDPEKNIDVLVGGWNLIGVGGRRVINISTVHERGGNYVWGWDQQNENMFMIEGNWLPLYLRDLLFPGLGYWVYRLE